MKTPGDVTAIGGVVLSALVFLAGQGMAGTLIAVTAQARGFSSLQIGLVGSAYYLGFIAGCIGGPKLIRQIGHRRSFAAVLLFAALTTALLALSATPVLWIAVRAAFGAAAAMVYTLIESWLNHLAENRNRGRVFGSYLVTKHLGSSIGQGILLVTNFQPWALFALVTALFATAWLPATLISPPAPAIGTARAVPQPALLLRLAPVGAIICALAGLANGAIWSLAPVYGVAHGFPRGLAGAFMGVFVVSGAAIQYPLGWFSDKLDRRRIVLGAAVAAAAIGLALAAMQNVAGWVTLLAMAAFGAAVLPLYGIGVSLVNDAAAADTRVQTAATLLLLNSMASAAGPTLAGLITQRFGLGYLFCYTAAVHAAIAACAWQGLRWTARDTRTQAGQPA